MACGPRPEDTQIEGCEVRAVWTSAACVLLLCAAGAGESPRADNGNTELISERGAFLVSYTSQLSPIVINEMHSWVIRVRTPEGEAVNGAAIELVGGMPLHDHGLPSMPQQTSDLGDGRYLIEGVKFHMGGWWEVSVTINFGATTDAVTFKLEL